MTTIETRNTDIEGIDGGLRRNRRRRRCRRPSVAGSSETTNDGSLCLSDSESDGQWGNSPLGSTTSGSCDEYGSSTEPQNRIRRQFDSVSERGLSEDNVDLESGELEVKVRSSKEERDCRICHLNLVSGGGGDQDGMVTIELGCSCKGDLGASHRQCAETWFKIKGNTTCEICGATVRNVVGEQTNEANNATGAASAPPVNLAETRCVCQGRWIMNFLFACMIFAFVISWLFHFNILP
ncbi:unnamed protein product [Ilex paraguariensis]|uniref:RING-CH-type domain-containing protein n=1 Tax=Ilex paraguariensis TaxID=185542 RepID=A0ABC8RWT8_9AQUA